MKLKSKNYNVERGFISKLPTPTRTERKPPEEIASRIVEEEEAPETMPRTEFNKREIQSQRDQNITELNEAIMAAPEDAAKLLTSFIRE